MRRLVLIWTLNFFIVFVLTLLSAYETCTVKLSFIHQLSMASRIFGCEILKHGRVVEKGSKMLAYMMDSHRKDRIWSTITYVEVVQLPGALDEHRNATLYLFFALRNRVAGPKIVELCKRHALICIMIATGLTNNLVWSNRREDSI